MTSAPRLGDLIVEHNLTDRAEVEHAAAEARRTGHRIAELLIARGPVAETDVYRLLAEQHGLRFGEAAELIARGDRGLSLAMPERYFQQRHVIPITRTAELLEVATSDPREPAEELAKALGVAKVLPVLVTPTDLRRLRNWADYDQPQVLLPKASDDLLAIERGQRPALPALFDALLLEAIGERASDIHLERTSAGVRVRIRVDGDLRTLPTYAITPAQLDGLVNVLKVRAGLDLAERRLPQGGRVEVTAGGRTYDLRIATQPSFHGENAIIRVLEQTPRRLQLEDLGMRPKQAEAFRRLLRSPQGLLLVVGPTGSGKTTTLYTGLQDVAEDVTRKLITIEDPVELLIDGAQQCNIHPEAGFTFAEATRSFVRQDPDVIMIGEVRDPETALEVVRASQTGHLVLSTLHCSDTIDALQRLRTLEVEPSWFAGEFIGLLAQRLVKRICPDCKRPVDADETLLRELFPRGTDTSFQVYRGAGCARCRQTGTHGRIGVFELLVFDDRLRAAVAGGASLDEYRRLALEAGMVPLRRSLLTLAQAGVASLESLAEVLVPERLTVFD